MVAMVTVGLPPRESSDNLKRPGSDLASFRAILETLPGDLNRIFSPQTNLPDLALKQPLTHRGNRRRRHRGLQRGF